MNTTAIIEHITKWLFDYSQNTYTNGFVVGVSGGIDSAVTSTLAARTGLPVMCLEMPIHQPADQVSRAMEHIEWLKLHFDNVEMNTVELTGIFDQFIEAVPPGEEQTREMALVNTRARLRMTALYYFAGLKGRLVAGTGNKVEDFGIGFFTKYGDGGVDISPIADLTKSEVYQVAQDLGIIESILNAPPTDGLWGDDRTDADQIGANYPALEWAMTYEGDETGLTDRQKEILDIYRKLHRANLHKMQPIPVCQIPSELR